PVQELASVAEVLRLEERRAHRRAIAAGPLQARLDDEDLIRAGHEVTLLVQDFPVFDQGEAIREGIGVHREEPLVDDRPLIEYERAEPRRQEEHGARRTGSVRKGV